MACSAGWASGHAATYIGLLGEELSPIDESVILVRGTDGETTVTWLGGVRELVKRAAVPLAIPGDVLSADVELVDPVAALSLRQVTDVHTYDYPDDDPCSRDHSTPAILSESIYSGLFPNAGEYQSYRLHPTEAVAKLTDVGYVSLDPEAIDLGSSKGARLLPLDVRVQWPEDDYARDDWTGVVFPAVRIRSTPAAHALAEAFPEEQGAYSPRALIGVARDAYIQLDRGFEVPSPRAALPGALWQRHQEIVAATMERRLGRVAVASVVEYRGPLDWFRNEPYEQAGLLPLTRLQLNAMGRTGSPPRTKFSNEATSTCLVTGRCTA